MNSINHYAVHNGKITKSRNTGKIFKGIKPLPESSQDLSRHSFLQGKNPINPLPLGTEGHYFTIDFSKIAIGSNFTNKASEILIECLGHQSAM